jgi:hypothetical protein
MSARWVPKCSTRPVHKLGTNATQRTFATQTEGPSARPQVGHPNATQVTSARWSPKCKTHPQQKRPHKGALGLKTSYWMDKKFFWLGGRVFNTSPPRLGTPTQRKARLQDGHPNATQDTSESWAPQCNTRHVRKLAAPMHVRTSASWALERNERHVRKMGAQTQRKARPQDGRPNEKPIQNENVHTREH